MTDSPILPPHVEQTLGTISELHKEHHRRATPSQKAVAQLTALAGRPRFVGLLTIGLIAWIGGNSLAKLAGLEPPDPPPFAYVEAIAGIASVYITLLILITQRHENELAEARDRLTLELAMLNEQKSAKIIALLEEMRRDLPSLPDRPDVEAEQLAQPADPQAVMEALRHSADDLEAVMAEEEAEADEARPAADEGGSGQGEAPEKPAEP